MKYINRRMLFFLMIISSILGLTVYVNASTCSNNDHTYLEATCEEARKCSKCSWTDPDSKPLGHVNTQFGCGKIHCTNVVCTRCNEHVDVDCNGGHTPATCSMAHCSADVCSVPGCTYHNGECGGDCVLVTCWHCKKVYCSRPNCENGKYEEHIPKESCPCDTNGECDDEHCIAMGMANGWCTMCANHQHISCNTDDTCLLGHCGQKMCSICKKHTCGGDHDYSKWETTGSGEIQTHTRVCSIEGCDKIGGSHQANWGAADATHTSYCKGSCNITYTHVADWKIDAQNSSDVLHQDRCKKVIGGVMCSATKPHVPKWSKYYKKGYEDENTRGDGNDSENVHTRRCNEANCGLEESVHRYTDEPWKPLNNGEEHIRTCSTCELKQVEKHVFNKRIPNELDLENYSHLINHSEICDKCDEVAKEEMHLDENKNGVCDECNQELWAIIDADTNEDITDKIINGSFTNLVKEKKIFIKEGSFDENEKKAEVRDVLEVTHEDGIKVIADDNNKILINQNGEYDFSLASGGSVTFNVVNICNDILIDVFKSTETATTGDVTIMLRLNSYETQLVEEGYKKVYIREAEDADDEITLSEFEDNTKSIEEMLNDITKTVSINGTYYFSARDNIGNEKTFSVVINNIVNGHATVAVSEDVFVGGYIFTEILINSSESWSLNDPLIIQTADPANSMYKIDAQFTKVKLDDDGINETEETGKIGDTGIKKIKVMDLRRNDAVLQDDGKYLPGIYYIQVAIGGSDVFKAKGTYIIDLKSVTLDDEEEALEGKNRVLVEVQDLNDLT